MDIGIIEAPTVKELFIQKITGMIIRGELKPGEKLPSERELAAQARISKSAVHFAMAELERLGFVETHARQGIFVSDYTKNGTIETLNLLMSYSSESFLDRDRMKDMLEMRMAIEGKALEMLANCLTPESFRILQMDVSASEAIARSQADNRALAVSFFDFHHDICFVSGNFILPLLFNSFRVVTLAYWEYAIRSLGRETCMKLMTDLLTVIQQKDAEKSLAFLHDEITMFFELTKNRR